MNSYEVTITLDQARLLERLFDEFPEDSSMDYIGGVAQVDMNNFDPDEKQELEVLHEYLLNLDLFNEKLER